MEGEGIPPHPSRAKRSPDSSGFLCFPLRHPNRSAPNGTQRDSTAPNRTMIFLTAVFCSIRRSIHSAVLTRPKLSKTEQFFHSDPDQGKPQVIWIWCSKVQSLKCSKLKVISSLLRKQVFGPDRSRQVSIRPDGSRQVQFWRRQPGSYRELSGPRRWEQKELSGPVGCGFPWSGSE